MSVYCPVLYVIAFLLIPMSAISFLIADPHQAVQAFARQQLEAYGFDAATIRTVSTPRAGVEAASEVKPDFLLTDSFEKEAMSGLGLYQAVCKHNADCCFAMVANNPSPGDEDDANQAGAYFFLAKPFTAVQFRDNLAQALKRLAQKHPQIAHHMERMTIDAPPQPPKIDLTHLPQHKPGDQVSYLNRRETVKHVILRRGELVVQLHGVSGMVEASKLQTL